MNREEEMTRRLFSDESRIDHIAIADWLNSCVEEDADVPIVLPMVQRGSVWKPAQIIDLWDSLLRGFPVGSFMLEEVRADIIVRRVGQSNSQRSGRDAFGLLDGQQRTLSMLIGWPNKPEMDRRIWVDFADDPAPEHLFRYRVTTENHPFGFDRGNPSSRLRLSDRQKAMCVYEEQNGRLEVGKFPDFKRASPYHSKLSLAIDLTKLISCYIDAPRSEEEWSTIITDLLKGISNWTVNLDDDGNLKATKVALQQMAELVSSDAVQNRIKDMHAALGRMLRLELPLLLIETDRIHPGLEANDGDPALAILFKRVGTNGTALTNEDYIFSVIKFHCPETHDLVEEMRLTKNTGDRDYNLAGLLTATGIVTTAVRLAVALWSSDQKSPLPDQEVLDKQQFSRLLRTTKGKGTSDSFLESAFLPLIGYGKTDCKLAKLFAGVGQQLRYRGFDDIGIPPYGLWILDRPLIQVLIYWMEIVGGEPDQITIDERAELIRFVLFWHVCVNDSGKASRIAYTEFHRETEPTGSMFRRTYERLVKDGVAMRVYSPDKLESLIPETISVSRTDRSRLLVNWKRFQDTEGDSDSIRAARQFYARWWGTGRGHRHPILLWLQRNTVSNFPGSPVAGREEETPFDYDHILPSSHWSGWRGVPGNDRILDFLADANGDRNYWVTGNSIGNIRVWLSGHNRSDGDASPRRKFAGRREGDLEPSLIGNVELWKKCSPNDEQKKHHWDAERTRAFQEAVETRAFDLYKLFYTQARFGQWEDRREG